MMYYDTQRFMHDWIIIYAIFIWNQLICNALCFVKNKITFMCEIDYIMAIYLCCDCWPSIKNVSTVAMAKLPELKFELLRHPPYSSDLILCDFFLFPNLKIWLRGKKFSSNEEVIAAVDAYFEGLETSYFSEGIKKLEHRWTKCVELQGDYVKKWKRIFRKINDFITFFTWLIEWPSNNQFNLLHCYLTVMYFISILLCICYVTEA